MARSLRDRKINQIMYISLGGVIVAIVLFIVLFNRFSSNKKESINVPIGDSNASEELITEEANSSIGKNVEEAQQSEGYEDVKEGQNSGVEDDTQAKGGLGIELSEVESESFEKNNVGEVARTAVQSNTLNNSEDVANTTNEVTSADDAGTESEAKVEESVPDPTFTMPVDGEILKPYGREKLIYSDTLKEWTTHLGIDIKADKTTVVKSSADGVVKSIKNDPRYGLTIVVEHQNGFSSVYANLLTSEFVVVGEKVKAGQTLGTVGNSATFEIVDENHLHFEILKDGEAVDPEMYLK